MTDPTANLTVDHDERIQQITFLDQIQVGDRMTMRREPATFVVLVGIADDGTPRTQMGASWVPAIRYLPAASL